MPGIELIQSLLQQASAQGSRSTAMNPISWALAILLSSLLGSVGVGAPGWVTVMLAVFTSVTMLLYLGAYVYFMVKNSDALRSERFTLSKMAIQNSLRGDTLRGFADIPEEEP